MKKTDDLPIISFTTQQDWELWLKENPETLFLEMALVSGRQAA
jgi:hypothetical protein